MFGRKSILYVRIAPDMHLKASKPGKPDNCSRCGAHPKVVWLRPGGKTGHALQIMSGPGKGQYRRVVAISGPVEPPGPTLHITHTIIRTLCI